MAEAQILPPPPPAPLAAPIDPLSWVILGAGGIAAGRKYLNDKKKKHNSKDNEI